MVNLVCIHPFGKYTKGQIVTDPAEVALLSADRDHHFVRVNAPAPAPAAPEIADDVDDPE